LIEVTPGLLRILQMGLTGIGRRQGCCGLACTRLAELGHCALNTLLECKGWVIAEHTACLFDRIVEMKADEFVACLVDKRRILGAAKLGDALDGAREGPRQRPRDATSGRFEPGQLGDPGDELPLCHQTTVGQIEYLTDGEGTFRGQEDACDKVLYIDTI